VIAARKSPDSPDPRLGPTLRAFREQRGQSQEDLAHHAGITTPALSRIESSKSNPSWTTVLRILGALDLSLADLQAAIERAKS
jgi:transcriptional regulator with XRE-family HTH domain